MLRHVCQWVNQRWSELNNWSRLTLSKFAALEATIAKLVADAEARSAAKEASVKAAEQVIKGKIATFEQQVQETATSATMAMQN